MKVDSRMTNMTFFVAANTFPICSQDLGRSNYATSEVREIAAVPVLKLSYQHVTSDRVKPSFDHGNFQSLKVVMDTTKKYCVTKYSHIAYGQRQCLCVEQEHES